MCSVQRVILLLALLLGGTSKAQALQCQVNPVNYTYVTTEVNCQPEPSCNNGSTNYTVCSTPSRLTDSQLGPQHNPTDNSSYYIFQGSAQSAARYYILFTFDQTVDVFNITLHYFMYNQGGLQPVLTAFGVGDDFELRNIHTNSAFTLRLHISRLHSPYRGLHSASKYGGGVIISSKVVLDINAGFLGSAPSFCLSEVEFFTRPRPGTPPTTSSTPATTAPTTDPPTTEPPTTATGPTTDLPVTTAIASPSTPAASATSPQATTPEEATAKTPGASFPIVVVAAAGGGAVGLTLMVAVVVATALVVACVCKKMPARTKRVEIEMAENRCYSKHPARVMMAEAMVEGEGRDPTSDHLYSSITENEYHTIPALEAVYVNAPKLEAIYTTIP